MYSQYLLKLDQLICVFGSFSDHRQTVVRKDKRNLRFVT